ncbi:DUF3540 domain-containing protein [Xenorhabdus bovienii]|uniref:DUF3540 domain-containing protein n=3 Tax=Xenorhabdus bovienii TaxID=40576 RepID=A0A077NB51_XENBV|nr:DUF3540 domain-containing protein [Xenorhabdus bovienii]CDG96224.1 conserved hypothetical protein [Xenorhabdus bovienii str. puntauvense]CDH02131.1 conserved hypothetical protein [Xenorhabdus bovienii str. feltiae Moldova]CDH23246.1 conserved hypothetical protein [Xenorhabdus bovienii str. kraussei Becker Underwood]
MVKSSYALSSSTLVTEQRYTEQPQTKQPSPFPSQQIVGQVVNIFQDGKLMVKNQNHGWHCRQAASCLLAPAMGDRVLLVEADEQLWILAILERAEQQDPAVIKVSGDLSIMAQGNLNLSSNGLNITAENGNCHINEMQYSGGSLSAWVSVSKIIGNQFESVWQTVTQLSHRLFRHTTQTEQVHAGQLDMQAENYMRLHAQNTVITAKAITKIDAEQIHIG